MDIKTNKKNKRQVLEVNLNKFCDECYHPCHCGEDNNMHADEYGVCTCEGCKCENAEVKEENEVQSC